MHYHKLFSTKMFSSIKTQADEIHLGSNVLVENDLYFVVNHLAEVRFGINREDYGFCLFYTIYVRGAINANNVQSTISEGDLKEDNNNNNNNNTSHDHSRN